MRVRYKRDRPEVEAERRNHARARGRDKEASAAGRRMASAKRDERERRQRALAHRRWLAATAAVVVVAAVVWGIVALLRAPIFTITTVNVTGTSHLTNDAVLKRARIPVGTTLLHLQTARVRDSLLAEPWIADVRLVKHFPHTLEIRVSERVPVAIVDTGGTALWLVDGGGRWIAKRTVESSAALPSIRDIDGLVPRAGLETTSAELANAIGVVAGISSELRSMVRTVSAPTIDRTTLILPGGVQVLVGSSQDIAEKDTIIRTILAQQKNVVFVNVRVVSRPTWRGLSTGN